MLRNARDAFTRPNIFVACREGSTRRIVMIDDGDGVPKHLQRTVFPKPRVTSKPDSMRQYGQVGCYGAACFVFHRGKRRICNYFGHRIPGLRSAFVIQTDLNKLPEKTDQSSFPTFELNEAGTVAVRGPEEYPTNCV